MDWDNVRITLTGLAMQATIERDSSLESKVISKDGGCLVKELETFFKVI